MVSRAGHESHFWCQCRCRQNGRAPAMWRNGPSVYGRAAFHYYCGTTTSTDDGCHQDHWGWTLQGDLYQPLLGHAPVVLVGDGRLGGISCTLSALESLLLRGYDVAAFSLGSARDHGRWLVRKQHYRAARLRVETTSLSYAIWIGRRRLSDAVAIDAFAAAHSGRPHHSLARLVRIGPSRCDLCETRRLSPTHVGKGEFRTCNTCCVWLKTLQQ